MKVLITGGAGYIGSHACVDLVEHGHEIVILDNLVNSNPASVKRVEELCGVPIRLEIGDVRDADKLEQLFSQHQFDAVMHFAGLKAVGESSQKPSEYYDNNVNGTRVLVDTMLKHNVLCLIFSSSATVYGDPAALPICENAQLGATNPYGRTKLVAEQMLSDIAAAHPTLSVVLLRYFNPAGAHQSGNIGEDPKGIPNNLMPYVAQVAVGRRESLMIFGNDYPTKDGTGVRDYIHVTDLVEGHRVALEKCHNTAGVHTFNLGTGIGYSVLDIVHAFENASGKEIAHQFVARRPGDIAECWSSSDKALQNLGWKAQRNLDDMVQDMLRWQLQNPQGYAQ